MPTKIIEIRDVIGASLKIPPLLQKQRGRILRPDYADAFLPDGFGFAFESELDRELFQEYATTAGAVRAALFALCNKFGFISGPLSSPIGIGFVFERVQGRDLWHVDRSTNEKEYYTLLTPVETTRAQTWICPLMHFLSVAQAELRNETCEYAIQTVQRSLVTTGAVTDRISEVADAVNRVLNEESSQRGEVLSNAIKTKGALAGGQKGWLLFSDPFVIHNGNRPVGDDKHVATFDLARGEDGEFRSVYASQL